MLEAVAPQQSVALKLRNVGDKSITGQVRIFAWRQENGADVLEPTDAVTVSPPIVEIRPGTDYTIRVVRTASAPIVGEETYRVVVDQVPDASARRNGVIAVVMRYVVPAFFVSSEAGQGRLSWSIARRGGKAVLTASNTGDRTVRLRDLSLGGTLLAKNLAGYVLGHSERSWKLPSKIPVGRAIKAISDNGPISGSAKGE